MKNSEFEIAFDNEAMSRFKNDSEWFKKIIAHACFNSDDGTIRHVGYLDITIDKERPIVTLLKYIRPITPDAKNAIDDEIEMTLDGLNGDSCIILIPGEDGNYIEPITNFKVADACFYRYDAEDIYGFSIGKDTYATLAYNNNELPPFGYPTQNTLQRWKESTVPYKDELLKYFEEVKVRTNNNFGLGFVDNEEIISALGQ